MSTEERQEMADRIREIQTQLGERVGELRELALADESGYGTTAVHYLIPTLECAVSSGHGWLSSEANLDDWIEALESDEDDEDLDE